MTVRHRIGAVHALLGSIGPTQASFERSWPEADVAHLLDGSLYLDRSRGTADADEIARRIDQLIRHSAATGAQAILFTGSFFGDAVRAAAPSVDVPVLTSFQGVIEAALAQTKPIRVLSTAADSTTLLVEELNSTAASRNQSIQVTGEVVPGALDALVDGDGAQHDNRVLDAIGTSDAGQLVVLAQFSMERVIEQAQAMSKATVLGPATEGVAHLRMLLG
jgi:Asp/Glu/hydantoin racemase